MSVYVLHAFCDGVLSETRVYRSRKAANEAAVRILARLEWAAGDGDWVVDSNGSRWSLAIEKASVE